MPHDPNTCPRCRWLAEREGWIQGEHELYLNKDGSALLIWLDTNGSIYYAPPSSCTSLDAVAGLLKELLRRGWDFCWDVKSQQWYVFKSHYRPQLSEHYFSDDYSCVIEAAMRVLGKESNE